MKAFVSEGALSEIVVKVIGDSAVEFLVELGFAAVAGAEQKTFSLMVPDQLFKIKLFERLRDEEVCFSAGRDWCPADVFEFLRDQKKLTGVYRKVVWCSPNKSRVIENC